MNGELVGVWFTTRTGTPAFRYEEDWIRSQRARALSISLPITAGRREIRGEVVTSYFENLLPDNLDIRKRLSSRFKAKSTSAFDLLTAIGRDCVGAVQLLPTNTTPDGWDRIESTPLTDADVEKILDRVTSIAPLGRQDEYADDDFRISIAGAQEKTALLRMGDEWHRPHGATPTTHILKLPLGIVGNMQADMKDSVENEWLCAQIIRELGINIAVTDMATFGRQKALVVRRFDRRWMGVDQATADTAGYQPGKKVWIARLPQEDFCQATGTPPDRKYESDGGPSMQDCLTLLAGSENADTDVRQFLLAQLAFWLLAATDGHAKNFSIYHRAGGSFGMTPIYDVLSAWPIIGSGANQLAFKKAKLAMAVRSKNPHYKLNDIQTRHWKQLAKAYGVGGLWEQMIAMTSSVDTALERVAGRLPDTFPMGVWNPIADGVKRQAINFLKGVEN